jgi:hypothetical protein
MGFRFNKRVGQFDHFKKNLSLKKLKLKVRGEKKKILGEPWIVHRFYRMRKTTI